jgi:hypothetical protein
MGFSSNWSVEAKEFEMVVVGGETGVRIRESCKGKKRSILLDRAELAWLLITFENLVCVEDSRVFWDQSQHGFPRIIVQRHFNRHGGYMVIEEFNGDRRKDSIFISKGRFGQGWNCFRAELRLVSDYFRAGFRAMVVESELHADLRGRISYAEVLAKTTPPLDAPFGAASGPVARVLRWVRECLEGINYSQPPAKCDAHFLAKDFHAQESIPAEHYRTHEKRTHPWVLVNRQRLPKQTVLAKTETAAGKTAPAPAGLSAVLGRTIDTRHGAVLATLLPAAHINHFGDSLDVGTFRETLERLQKEIGFCLKGLAMFEGGGPGCAFSRPKPRACAEFALGFKVPRPKMKFLAHSKSARDTKGKGPMICPSNWPKVFNAKEGPGSRLPSALLGLGASPSRVDSLSGLDAWIFTPGASSSRLVPTLVPAVGYPSSDGQSRTLVMVSPLPVPMGSEVSAARVDPPQYPDAGFPTPSPLCSVAGHPILQG